MKNRLFIKYSIYGSLFGLFISILEIIGSLINPGSRTLNENIINALIIFIPSGLLISTLLFWYIEFHLPKKRISFLSQKTYTEFEKLGFEKKDGYIEGYFKGFPCVLLWSPISVKHRKLKSGFSSIIIDIQSKMNTNKVKILNKKYKNKILSINENGIANNIEIYFTKPKFEKY